MNWGKQTSLMKKDQDGFCPIKGIYEKLGMVLGEKKKKYLLRWWTSVEY